MAKREKAKSPYQKYSKTPFRYEHSSCRHSRSMFQAVPVNDGKDVWRGEVCATCNIIIKKLSDQQSRLAA